ncbi:serine/arginine repetitive matrix protein 1-like, partial [Dipodomys spectabilis]|uniref:serine/arginine repetitive matrix protein 1-like n=1 Tax=Dipodomys spectabilis TaxID=105255 RepID=UPI001C53AB64
MRGSHRPAQQGKSAPLGNRLDPPSRDVNLNGNFSLAQKPHEPEDGRDTPRAAGWHKAADNARIGNDTTTQPQAPERTNRERSGSTARGQSARRGFSHHTARASTEHRPSLSAERADPRADNESREERSKIRAPPSSSVYKSPTSRRGQGEHSRARLPHPRLPAHHRRRHGGTGTKSSRHHAKTRSSGRGDNSLATGTSRKPHQGHLSPTRPQQSQTRNSQGQLVDHIRRRQTKSQGGSGVKGRSRPTTSQAHTPGVHGLTARAVRGAFPRQTRGTHSERPESREGRRTRRRAQTELLVDPTKLPPPAQTGHRRESGDARPHPALACGRKVRQNSRPGATATPRRQSRPAPGRGRASARLAAARPPPPPLARSAENEGTVISKRTPGGARQPPSNDRLHRAAVPRIGARRPALSSGDTEHGNKSPHSPPPRTEWHNLGQDLQPGPLCDLTNDTRATRDLDRDRAAAAAAAAASDQSETRNQDDIRPNGAARTREPGSRDRSQAGRGGKDGRPAPREKTNRPPARPPPPVARPPPPPNMARKGQMETRKRKKKKKKLPKMGRLQQETSRREAPRSLVKVRSSPAPQHTPSP